MKSYFNTTNETDKLPEYTKKAKSQETRIRGLFVVENKMTPSEVWNKFNDRTPITSVRRALSVMVKKNLLKKTKSKKLGIYNRKEHVYKLRKNRFKIGVK